MENLNFDAILREYNDFNESMRIRLMEKYGIEY